MNQSRLQAKHAASNKNCATVDGSGSEEKLCKSLRQDMVYHHWVHKDRTPVPCDEASAQKWVKLRVDLPSTEVRQTNSTVNGMKIGGHLLVCFTKGRLPDVKIGEDKVVLKRYQVNHSSWEMD